MKKHIFNRKKMLTAFILSMVVSLSALSLSGCEGITITKLSKPHFVEDSKTSDGKRAYIDSINREVKIGKVKKVVPSGKVAQLMISMVAPEKLASVSEAKRMYQNTINEDLPITGQLYGGQGSVNYEEIMSIAPDLIVDTGEVKKTIKEDMDEVQDITGIPTIFLNSDLEHTPEAFRALGELLDEPERAEKLAKFTEEALAFAKEGAAKVKEKKKVYQTTSDDGLGADIDGTAHTEILNLIGAENAAKMEAKGGKPGQTVPMEQILSWNPDVIIVNSLNGEEFIKSSDMWGEIKAVKDGQIYTVPQAPYSWISRPPSANRIIGMYWMALKVYPEIYHADLKAKTKEWYKIAYDYDLTDEEYERVLNNELH